MRRELDSVEKERRGFSTGFYFGTPGPEGIGYNESVKMGKKGTELL